MRILFNVAGLPGTKGSARAFVRGKKAVIVNDAGDKARTWASQVADAARAAMEKLGLVPFQGEVSVHIEYFLPRPKSHYWPVTKKRPAPILKEDAPVRCSCKPDGDKLDRCLWDALTGIIFGDDALIVSWSGAKYYSDPEPVGARVRILGPGLQPREMP